jgi:hypothetical protein
VSVGLTVALALAVLSVFRVSSDGVAYRKPETWSNTALLALSEASFLEGRSELPEDAQPDRFAGLVDSYAARVTSDEVIAALKRQGLLKSDTGAKEELPFAASPVPSAATGAPTPLLKITASGPTAYEATRLTTGVTDTFIRVVQARQIRAGTPPSERIKLDILTRAGVPQLTGPRSRTTPIIVFLACMTAVFAAAFIRDNTQRKEPPRQRKEPHQLEAAPDADPDPTALPHRRRSSGSSR